MSSSTAIIFRPNWTVQTPAEFRAIADATPKTPESADKATSEQAAEVRGPRLVLDRADECVWYGARKITLAPKAFSLLRYLAERRGRLVTKDELLDAVWPGVFVGDAVLKVAVREIRQALDDDAREPQFIQTAHRRG